MQIKLEKKYISEANYDVVIVNVFEGQKNLDGVFSMLDKNVYDNKITELVLGKEKFDGKYGETYKLPFSGDLGTVLVAGMGKKEELTREKVRNLTAKIMRMLNKSENAKSVAAVLFDEGLKNICTKGYAQMMTEGAISGCYAFDRYKSAKQKNTVEELIICEPDEERFLKAQKGINLGQIVADSVNMARDLINDSAQYIYPETLAQFAVENSGVKTTVYNKEQIKAMGMNAFLAVGQGSVHEPRLIHMEYKSENPKKKIAIIGKGITFDAGGLDLKPPSSMLTMRDDMSGAAAVITVMRAISQLKPDIELHAIVAACENMPSGSAYKPGDVIKAKTGRTIEIDNTDAEGRVTLADALAYAEELGVDEIIDIATLTGACMVALGTVASGIMGNNEEKIKEFIEAASKAGERFWQMPMYEEYGDSLKSDIADTKNTGGRMGGTSAAGIFLSKFITKNTPWLHLDIAGTAFLDSANAEGIKGATGIGVRSLIKYINSGSCGCGK